MLQTSLDNRDYSQNTEITTLQKNVSEFYALGQNHVTTLSTHAAALSYFTGHAPTISEQRVLPIIS